MFSHVSGNFIHAARFIGIEFDVIRTVANGILKDPGRELATGRFAALDEMRERYAAQGIICRVEQTVRSPWVNVPDEELEKLLYEQAWKSLPKKKRYKWLHTVHEYYFYCVWTPEVKDVPNRIVHIDDGIVDQDGFFLAIGEAINGPGGYFGACPHSFRDCLGGGFGVALPLTIRWYMTGVSRIKFRRLDKFIEQLKEPGITIEIFPP